MGHTTKLSDYMLETAETSSPDNPVDDPDEAPETKKKAPPKDATTKGGK